MGVKKRTDQPTNGQGVSMSRITTWSMLLGTTHSERTKRAHSSLITLNSNDFPFFRNLSSCDNFWCSSSKSLSSSSSSSSPSSSSSSLGPSRPSAGGPRWDHLSNTVTHDSPRACGARLGGSFWKQGIWQNLLNLLTFQPSNLLTFQTSNLCNTTC